MASFGNGVIQEDEDLTSAGRDYLPQVIVTPLGSGAIQDLDNRFLVTRSNPTS